MKEKVVRAERWLYLLSEADCRGSTLTPLGHVQVAQFAWVMLAQLASSGRSLEALAFDMYGEGPQTADALAEALWLPDRTTRYRHRTGRHQGGWEISQGEAKRACQPTDLLRDDRVQPLLDRLLPEGGATGAFVARAPVLELIAHRLLPPQDPRGILPGQLWKYRVPVSAADGEGALDLVVSGKERRIVPKSTAASQRGEVWIYLLAHGAVSRPSRQKARLSIAAEHDLKDDVCLRLREELSAAGRALHRVYARGEVRLSKGDVRGEARSPSALTAALICEEFGLRTGLRDHGDPTRGEISTPYNQLKFTGAPAWQRARGAAWRFFAPMDHSTGATLIVAPPEDVEYLSRLLDPAAKLKQPIQHGELRLRRYPIGSLHR